MRHRQTLFLRFKPSYQFEQFEFDYKMAYLSTEIKQTFMLVPIVRLTCSMKVNFTIIIDVSLKVFRDIYFC